MRRAWRSAQRLGHRPRPALGEAARSGLDDARRAQLHRAAPARLGARGERCWSRRTTTSPGGRRSRRGSRDTTYILWDGESRTRARAPARAAAAAADRSSSRRRRAHRRRPGGALRGGGGMSAALEAVHRRRAWPSGSPPADFLSPTATGRRWRPGGPGGGRCARSCCRSPARRSRVGPFDAALRLAKAEDAMLMPAYLAKVPMQVPLDVPLPKQSSKGMPLLEAIEQRAVRRGVQVDSRVDRGRSYRDALRRLLDDETVRPRHRLGHRQPARRLHQRRPEVAAGAGAGRGADPPPGARRHEANLVRVRRQGPLLSRGRTAAASNIKGGQWRRSSSHFRRS